MGLRHFSMKVCRKVEKKGKTTYNEVANELLKEVFAKRVEVDAKGKLDEKNTQAGLRRLECPHGHGHYLQG